MKLSVVIPVFNEVKTIDKIVDRVIKEKTLKEVIIVDDGSTDGTWEEIKAQRSKISRACFSEIKDQKTLKIFRNERNLGKGAAVREGIKEAKGDILIIQDADLEYDPKYYSELLAPIIANKTQVVYGSRLKTMKLTFWGKNKTPLPLHYLANRFLSAITNFLYGSKLTDMETCYKVMTKEIYQNLNLVSDRFEIEPEITAKILKKGYRIYEVPITTKPRSYKEGKKIKAKDTFLALFTLFKYLVIK